MLCSFQLFTPSRICDVHHRQGIVVCYAAPRKCVAPAISCEVRSRSPEWPKRGSGNNNNHHIPPPPPANVVPVRENISARAPGRTLPIRGVVPESWLEWALGAEGDRAPRLSQRPTGWLRTTLKPRGPGKPFTSGAKLVNQGGHAARTASLEQRPSGPGDPLEVWETNSFAKARCRSPQWGRGHCVPSGEANKLAAGHTRRRVRGNETRFPVIADHVAVRCPCCDVDDVDTRHACICPSAGAQVNQHQQFLHTICRTLKPLGIPHQA